MSHKKKRKKKSEKKLKGKRSGKPIAMSMVERHPERANHEQSR